VRIERRRWDGEDATGLAVELREGDVTTSDVGPAVAETIRRVREEGDAALLELGERFDGARPSALRIEDGALAEAEAAMDPGLRSAIERSAANIRAVAEAQIKPERQADLPEGQRITVTEVPVGSAAIYVPGGRAPYPSSVLMGVIPAIVAGVGRVVVASPPSATGLPDPAILAAAKIAGASEVYAMGGAQAIAALAYGTESVAAIDVIAGPGSPWVQEAKLQVSRVVGIDGYAGPSELMAICAEGTTAEWIALDLCAQAEHGDDGLLVAASTDATLLDSIATAVERLASEFPSVHEARLDLIEVPDFESALALAERIAPEHLELAGAGAEALAESVTTAGCVFVGDFGGAAFGDYSAGSNHVLPTGGAGRFTGPLGPGTFRRRISRVELDAGSAAALAPIVDVFANAEGFPVHGQSTLARAKGPNQQAS
jgi:histidinol dehydrogenase